VADRFHSVSALLDSNWSRNDANSSRLVLRFVGLLYKIVDQEKYRDPNRTLKRQLRRAAARDQPINGSSQSLPIDLTSDDDGIRGAVRSLTPNTSLCSSRPTSSHTSVSQHWVSGMDLDDQNSLHMARLALPAYKSPAVSDIPEILY
jgi:hypothetical protein